MYFYYHCHLKILQAITDWIINRHYISSEGAGRACCASSQTSRRSARAGGGCDSRCRSPWRWSETTVSSIRRRSHSHTRPNPAPVRTAAQPAPSYERATPACFPRPATAWEGLEKRHPMEPTARLTPSQRHPLMQPRPWCYNTRSSAHKLTTYYAWNRRLQTICKSAAYWVSK